MPRSDNPNCSCDYSYVCNSCQEIIDRENRVMYENEMFEWMAESIEVIAKEQGISLPPRPMKPSW